ncbi:MAG TPA: hypothetical protein P5284_00075 [Candidatus Contendobacter sp.]|nr:hypothetical protein [Candidatus Contendobacter sp.]HRZ22930.1 hypothetical protein [Candidatus Contendobacter sp.]HRZ51549.1 hypothetical protein [Candidatus Contendobacter sp.]
MSLNHRPTFLCVPHRFRWWTAWLLLLLTPGLSQAQQPSDAKVAALVEALRVAAPPASADAGLYSDWRIKPDNITRWSRRCVNQEVTPEQFAADQALARTVLVCVLGPVLRDQFDQSNRNEIVAVQRAAAWWMAGDPAQYRTGATGDYTLRVLEAYLRFF